MKIKNLFPALSLLIPTIAQAQPMSESESADHHVEPATNAVEISIASGYTQGVGKTGGGMNDLQDLSGPGGGFELGLGYRVIPNLTIGAYGGLSLFDNGDAISNDIDVIGASAGLQAAWHFRPDRSFDPWVKLGGGWKGLWLEPARGKATSLQGLDLARLQVGLDYRVSQEVAIAPVIGGSLGMFISEDSPMTPDYTEIKAKEVNFTGFVGLAGTFDAK